MEPTVDETFLAKAAECGARWLDEDRPGWWDTIQVHQLVMQDGSACIIGQTYGYYGNEIDSVRSRAMSGGFTLCHEGMEHLAWEVDHGFLVDRPQILASLGLDEEKDEAYVDTDEVYDAIIESKNRSYDFLGGQWMLQIERRKESVRRTGNLSGLYR